MVARKRQQIAEFTPRADGESDESWRERVGRMVEDSDPFLRSIVERYCGHARSKGCFDDVLNAARGEAFKVLAEGKYDASKGELSTFLWHCVKFRMWEAYDATTGRQRVRGGGVEAHKEIFTPASNCGGEKVLREVKARPEKRAAERLPELLRSLLDSPGARLTAKERQTLQLLGEGRTQREIAGVMGVSYQRVQQAEAAAIAKIAKRLAGTPLWNEVADALDQRDEEE